MLAILESGQTFEGRTFFEKAKNIGMKPLKVGNNVNFSLLISSYLSMKAKQEGKVLSKMSPMEFSTFIETHKDGANNIITGSQPMLGMANRPPVLMNPDNWLARTLLTFRSASIAGVNSSRRVIELKRQGKITNTQFATMYANAIVLPVAWCSLVTYLYGTVLYGWLSGDDEEELKKVEESKEGLLKYLDVLVQEGAGQVPLLGELLWYVKKVAGDGNQYGSSAFNLVPLDVVNKTFAAGGDVFSFAKQYATDEEYEKSGDGYKRYDLKWKNEKNIDKAIDGTIKIFDVLVGVNLSEPRKLYNKANED
jgi:hypothetical protein